MGQKQSKQEQPAEPLVEEQKDERWELSRDLGPNMHDFSAKLLELKSKRVDDLVPRPVHVSGYFRELPQYQGWWFYLGVWGVFLRKMPFTNPLVRLYFWILGLDLLRSRMKWYSLIDDMNLKEVRCFDMIYHRLTTRYGVRLPDFKNEWEDWYDMNKPAYRVPVPHEYSMDSWMRFLAINHNKYKLRPVQWNGKWEQEIVLNMDVHAPHTDHWGDIH